MDADELFGSGGEFLGSPTPPPQQPMRMPLPPADWEAERLEREQLEREQQRLEQERLAAERVAAKRQRKWRP